MARSSGKAFTNFSAYEEPFPTRARMVLANNWKKLAPDAAAAGTTVSQAVDSQPMSP